MSIQAALPLEYDLWGRLPVQVEAVEEYVASDAGLLSIRAAGSAVGLDGGLRGAVTWFARGRRACQDGTEALRVAGTERAGGIDRVRLSRRTPPQAPHP